MCVLCACMCVCTCVYVCVCVCVCVCKCKCMCMYLYMYARVWGSDKRDNYVLRSYTNVLAATGTHLQRHPSIVDTLGTQ